MGLLDKTNPAATRKSVIRWAIFGAIAGPVVIILLHVFNKPIPQQFLPVILIASALAGSALSALGEWQVDDNDDVEKPVEADSRSGVWGREIDT